MRLKGKNLRRLTRIVPVGLRGSDVGAQVPAVPAPLALLLHSRPCVTFCRSVSAALKSNFQSAFISERRSPSLREFPLLLPAAATAAPAAPAAAVLLAQHNCNPSVPPLGLALLSSALNASRRQPCVPRRVDCDPSAAWIIKGPCGSSCCQRSFPIRSPFCTVTSATRRERWARRGEGEAASSGLKKEDDKVKKKKRRWRRRMMRMRRMRRRGIRTSIHTATSSPPEKRRTSLPLTSSDWLIKTSLWVWDSC